MKDKILTFVIGVLVGAIITAGVFLMINQNNSSKSNNEVTRGSFGQSEVSNSTSRDVPTGEKQHKSKQKNSSTNSTNSAGSEAPAAPKDSSNSQEKNNTTENT